MALLRHRLLGSLDLRHRHLVLKVRLERHHR
jgi:hypothetical protein